ncbi:T9SS type A sorting domain-containing protein [Flavobacterium sp. GCM10023249]|uniref:T9SS type A sorting domain-containing protein n=1 Tax=unclassified Flavobacterium TaxID=196869 RepID=UPI0036217974
MKLKHYLLLPVLFLKINLFGQISNQLNSRVGKDGNSSEISATQNSNPSLTSASSHLNFDGVNDYVAITHFERPTEFTFEAMIKTSVTSEVCILSWIDDQIDTGYNVDRSKIKILNGKLLFHFDLNSGGIPYSSSGRYMGNITINDNLWHHIAVVKKNQASNDVLLYVDGVLDITGTLGIYQYRSKNIYLGADGKYVYEAPIANSNLSKHKKKSENKETQRNVYSPIPFEFYPGDLDEVRVWNRALPIAEIQNNINCELPSPTTQNGLIAYYNFNQGLDGDNNSSVTTLTDATSNGYNGTLTDFALNGTTSNWMAGSSIVSGNTCAPFLSTTDFEINHQFKLYPNPATNEVTIEFKSLTNVQLEIIDINGRVLLNQALDYTSNKLNMTTLPSGIYFFKINSKEGVATSRVIKH